MQPPAKPTARQTLPQSRTPRQASCLGGRLGAPAGLGLGVLSFSPSDNVLCRGSSALLTLCNHPLTRSLSENTYKVPIFLTEAPEEGQEQPHGLGTVEVT